MLQQTNKECEGRNLCIEIKSRKEKTRSKHW